MSVNIKRWTIVFRVLSSPNRLKIIKMLSGKRKMTVGDISVNLKVSFNAVSNNLAILKNLDILEAEGRDGHVFYSINSKMPNDFRKILNHI